MTKTCKLLKHFDITMSRRHHQHQSKVKEVCQQQYIKMFGMTRPNLTYAQARGVLAAIRNNQSLTHPLHKKCSTRVRKKAKPSNRPRIEAKFPSSFVNSSAFLTTFEWRTLRYAALRDSEGICSLCARGRQHGVILNVDHIKPRRTHPQLALEPSNLQVLCGECNHGKGNWDDTDWR